MQVLNNEAISHPGPQRSDEKREPTRHDKERDDSLGIPEVRGESGVNEYDSKQKTVSNTCKAAHTDKAALSLIWKLCNKGKLFEMEGRLGVLWMPADQHLVGLIL
jgi:hypothetical protein